MPCCNEVYNKCSWNHRTYKRMLSFSLKEGWTSVLWNDLLLETMSLQQLPDKGRSQEMTDTIAEAGSPSSQACGGARTLPILPCGLFSLLLLREGFRLLFRDFQCRPGHSPFFSSALLSCFPSPRFLISPTICCYSLFNLVECLGVLAKWECSQNEGCLLETLF